MYEFDARPPPALPVCPPSRTNWPSPATRTRPRRPAGSGRPGFPRTPAWDGQSRVTLIVPVPERRESCELSCGWSKLCGTEKLDDPDRRRRCLDGLPINTRRRVQDRTLRRLTMHHGFRQALGMVVVLALTAGE